MLYKRWKGLLRNYLNTTSGHFILWFEQYVQWILYGMKEVNSLFDLYVKKDRRSITSFLGSTNNMWNNFNLLWISSETLTQIQRSKVGLYDKIYCNHTATGHSSIKYYHSHLIGESSNKITKNKRCKMHHKNTHIYKFKNIKI